MARFCAVPTNKRAIRSTNVRGVVVTALVSVAAGSSALPAATSAEHPRNRGHAGHTASCTAVTRPGQGLQRFVDQLRPGSIGCLLPGDYNAGRLVLRASGTPTSGITLTSVDTRRKATIHGVVWLTDSANYWTVADLNLDGRNRWNLPSPIINGDYSTWRSDDVTNHAAGEHASGGGICFSLGATHMYGYAANTTIEQSLIHDCGISDNANHGIYIVATVGSTIIRNNWIFRNGDRGIQLYPDANHVLITHNVIDSNGTGVMFSGLGAFTSSDIVVTGNIISNSRHRWNVESWYPVGTAVGTQNVVTGNCLWANSSNPFYDVNGGVAPPVGFRLSGNNVVQRPVFSAAAAGDLRLRKHSGCRGFGPMPKQSPPRK